VVLVEALQFKDAEVEMPEDPLPGLDRTGVEGAGVGVGVGVGVAAL